MCSGILPHLLRAPVPDEQRLPLEHDGDTLSRRDAVQLDLDLGLGEHVGGGGHPADHGGGGLRRGGEDGDMK